MKKQLLIVSGESYWQEFLPDFSVHNKKIQHTSWVWKSGELLVADPSGVVKPDAILWRVGAIKPQPLQTHAMNLIELAQVPCVNDPSCLKIGFDRLSMLSRMKGLGLPVIPFQVVSHSFQLKHIALDFPFVVKVGNYHGGYGKSLIENAKQWQDMLDMLFITEAYITVEPFIPYVRDIRYLAIGDRVWAMARKGKYWKANVETQDFQVIQPDEMLSAQLKKLQESIQADIVAIDLLEDKQGDVYMVEYNDIPGLSGFPDAAKYELVDCLRARLSSAQ